MKKVLISIFLVILIFFSFTNNVQANFFTDDKEDTKSEIEETIDDLSEVFVYGHEVDDFKILQKDYIFTVAVAALQEVDRQVQSLKQQLDEYFNKQRTTFEIPLQLIGSPFQVKAWKELLNIPYGKTISYKEQALNIQQDKAHRAVANANAQNMIAILVPCHRVIASSGKLSGYNGGVEKKEFLLKLESNND